MKTFLNKIAVVVTIALATTVAARAQSTQTIEYGRTILQFTPSFTGGLSQLGATIGGVGFSSVDSTGTIVFPVVSGAVDLATAQGEVNHLGGIAVYAQGNNIRLQNFLIDTTGAPVLTGLVVLNGKLIGRIPLFNLTPPAGLTLPLQTTVGVLQLNGFNVTLSATAAATFNSIFGANVLAGGTPVGTLSVYAVVSPNSAS